MGRRAQFLSPSRRLGERAVGVQHPVGELAGAERAAADGAVEVSYIGQSPTTLQMWIQYPDHKPESFLDELDSWDEVGIVGNHYRRITLMVKGIYQ